MRYPPVAAFITVLLALPLCTRADDVAFFESRIRPVLVEHCYSCHASDAKELKGGLLLDSGPGLRRGGGGAGRELQPRQIARQIKTPSWRFEFVIAVIFEKRRFISLLPVYAFGAMLRILLAL